MTVTRATSRVLLLDREDRMLLFLTVAPDTSGVARWLTPGGGVDPGESHHDAAVRELDEETGLVIPDLGDPVWTHDFAVEWDAADHDRGHAVFYLARVDAFEPSHAGWTPEERVEVLDERWWTVDELASTSDLVEPLELVGLFRSAIATSGPAVSPEEES